MSYGPMDLIVDGLAFAGVVLLVVAAWAVAPALAYAAAGLVLLAVSLRLAARTNTARRQARDRGEAPS